jgi:hypothetical protein
MQSNSNTRALRPHGTDASRSGTASDLQGPKGMPRASLSGRTAKTARRMTPHLKGRHNAPMAYQQGFTSGPSS